jgi:hypothetical protein
VTFLHPLALLGLAAAAIPALLHLLQRRTPPELEFPPLRYLSEAERQSARRLKLRHLLLLILRTALVIVIVLAAARPLVPAVGRAAGGAHEPTAVVVILDNSPSSGAVVDGRPVLARLRDAAHASIAGATSADRVWLILADGVVRGGSREALLASVDSVPVGRQRLDLVRAVERAARLAHAEPLPGREVHVLSDLQRSALAEGRADVPGGVRVLALGQASGSERPPANRGVSRVRAGEGAAVVSVVGSGGGDPAPLTVRLRGRDVGRGLAAPGTAVSVALPAQPPGWWVGEAALEPDELRGDDRRPFVWRVAPPARVAAEPAAGPFVAAALAVLREAHHVADGRDVTVGDAPGGGPSIVLPPSDAALVGQANRALAARGVPWRWNGVGTPGPIAASTLDMLRDVQVSRRYRLEPTAGASDSLGALATVNGGPWLVRAGDVVLLGSRLDTAWTSLPAAPGFVPFVDALVNRIAAGETDVEEVEGAPGVVFRVRGGDTVGATVSGPDPRESDLTPAPPALAAAALGGADRVEVLAAERFAAARFAGTRQSDISGVLLVLAFLLAALELGVATLTR